MPNDFEDILIMWMLGSGVLISVQYPQRPEKVRDGPGLDLQAVVS